MRISVIGTCGSGKTTIAKRLSTEFGLNHYELDAIFWQSDWRQTPDSEFRSEVIRIAGEEKWVIDGNYRLARDVVWARATHVIWLDYPFVTVFWRLLRRTLGRLITREELFNGNRETIIGQFFAKDSLILNSLKVYRHRRIQFTACFSTPEYSGLNVIRIRSRKDEDLIATHVSGE